MTGEELRDYTGVWSGYVEAYTFAGSDQVRLTVGEDGSGSFEVGDQPPLAPPEDPSVGYPVGWTMMDFERRSPLISGYAYPLHETSVAERRIRFGLQQLEVFAEWCGMQPPVSLGDVDHHTGYGCMPNVGTKWVEGDCAIVDPETEEDEPVDCGWLLLCTEVCVYCTEERCNVSPLAAASSFDAALEDSGETLVGTLLLHSDSGEERLTVRMTREH